MPQTVETKEPGLQEFLATIPPEAALRIRTLAHAWEGGGGRLFVGRFTVRLLAVDGAGRAYTAGNLHRAHGDPPRPTLELGRTLLQLHGVTPTAWTEWCDERPDLPAHGFDAQAKFPLVRLDGITDATLARLALGLRDLALLVTPRA